MYITAISDSERMKGPKMGCTHCTVKTVDAGLSSLFFGGWQELAGQLLLNCAVVLSVK